jgi:Tfp pilus assembly protein PilF
VKTNKTALAKQQLEETLQISPNYNQADLLRKAIAQSPQRN